MDAVSSADGGEIQGGKSLGLSTQWQSLNCLRASPDGGCAFIGTYMINDEYT